MIEALLALIAAILFVKFWPSTAIGVALIAGGIAILCVIAGVLLIAYVLISENWAACAPFAYIIGVLIGLNLLTNMPDMGIIPKSWTAPRHNQPKVGATKPIMGTSDRFEDDDEIKE